MFEETGSLETLKPFKSFHGSVEYTDFKQQYIRPCYYSLIQKTITFVRVVFLFFF
jgi:hypothetical protein